MSIHIMVMAMGGKEGIERKHWWAGGKGGKGKGIYQGKVLSSM
jgi:hypothetical protein